MTEVLYLTIVFMMGAILGMKSERSRTHRILDRLSSRMRYHKRRDGVEHMAKHMTTVLIATDYLGYQVDGRRFDWEEWSLQRPELFATCYRCP